MLHPVLSRGVGRNACVYANRVEGVGGLGIVCRRSHPMKEGSETF